MRQHANAKTEGALKAGSKGGNILLFGGVEILLLDSIHLFVGNRERKKSRMRWECVLEGVWVIVFEEGA